MKIRWLGQAGFLISLSNGKKLAIDPYLGNSCWDIVGFRRMVPAPIGPKELDVDYLFISHEHPDHLDIDLYDALQDKPQTRIFGNEPCKALLSQSGRNPDKMEVLTIGQTLELDGVSVDVMRADHGLECPGALGFLFHIDGTTVYFAGDTAYTPELLQEAYEAKPEIGLLPINGAYGNLGSEEAARLAADIGCKKVIPCHFWMFVEHGSNPLEFSEKMKMISPMSEVCFLSVGEEIEV